LHCAASEPTVRALVSTPGMVRVGAITAGMYACVSVCRPYFRSLFLFPPRRGNAPDDQTICSLWAIFITLVPKFVITLKLPCVSVRAQLPTNPAESAARLSS